MESVKQETHIHQNINKNYGTATIAQGSVKSINNVTLNDSQDIKELIESLKDLDGEKISPFLLELFNEDLEIR